MAETVVDQALVEAFLEMCGGINFEIVASGRGSAGVVTPTLQKTTKYSYGNKPKTMVDKSYNGLRTGVTVDGLTRVFHQAASLAQDNDDWYGAIVALVECGYYDQVTLRPMKWVSRSDGSAQENPLVETLEPLIWRVKDNKVTTHGGARLGAGRPSLEGRLVSVDMPESMIEDLQKRAKRTGTKKAKLIREFVQRGLDQELDWHLLWEPEATRNISMTAHRYAVSAYGFESIEALVASGAWLHQSLTVPPDGVYQPGVNTALVSIQYQHLSGRKDVTDKAPLYLAIHVSTDFSCDVQEIEADTYNAAYNAYQTKMAERMKQKYGVDIAPDRRS